jgi:hypothetical protein
VSFVSGPLHAAVESVSTETVDGRMQVVADCDLAVMVNPDPRTLARAWAALRPGGACYAEWRRPVVGGVRTIRGRLTRAGFTRADFYWPWPAWVADGPHFWLPLECPDAVRDFAASRPRARRLGERLVQLVGRATWPALSRLGLTLPLCVCAFKPTEDRRPVQPLVDALVAQARGSSGETTIRRPEPTCWVWLTAGRQSINKVVALGWDRAARRTDLVVKLPRGPEARPGLLREAESLKALADLGSARPDGTPRLVAFDVQTGAVVESALRGEPLMARLTPANYRELAHAAADWLAQLVHRGRTPGSSTPEEMISAIAERFRQQYGEILDPELARASDALLAAIGPVPSAIEHRDFAPWNILRTRDGRLVALDWESAEPNGLAGLDLVYFTSLLGFALRGASSRDAQLAAYHELHSPGSELNDVTSGAFSRYAAASGLALERLPALRALAWMLHADSEYHRIVAEHGSSPPAALLREALFVGLWSTEIARVSRKLAVGVAR